MPVYIVTGKLGSGKTLVSVGKIRDKLVSGCPVATNLDLNLHKLVGPKARKTRVMRIPDKPTLDDLEAIGNGNASYDEDNNGLLVLDECGTWFNSRSWADKSRQSVINWFLHARKLGWDIIFLIQDHSIMDKQARVSLVEHVVYCRRMDRMAVPLVGAVFKAFTGSRLPLPKVHLAIVKYGDQQHSIIVDRWTYTGRNLYAAYDTKQSFSDDYPHGTYSKLPPWLSHGVFMVPRDPEFYMRMTRIYWKRFSRPLVAGLAFGIGVLSTGYVLKPEPAEAVEPVAQVRDVDLTPYRDARISGFSRLGSDVNYSLVVGGETHQTRDLEPKGYGIQVGGPCSMLLTGGADYVQIGC